MPRRPPTPDLAPLDRAVLGPHGLAGLDETELARLYASLTDTERADLARLLASQPKPLWTPLPGPQTWAMENQSDVLLFGGQAGGGKMSSLDSQVLTPFGFKKLGDVKVGDYVTDPRTGGVTPVLYVWDHARKPLWKVTFDDGTCLSAGAEHLWVVRASGSRNKSYERATRLGLLPEDKWLNGYRVTDTLGLQRLIQKSESQKDRGIRSNWPHIPVCRPVEFTVAVRYPDGYWQVDPYWLGILLGDGHMTSSVGITTADDEIRDGFAHYLDTIDDRARITSKPNSKAWAVHATGNHLRYRLESLGVAGCTAPDKFVPKQYKIAPMSARSALMAGLIDSDGYIDSRGHMSYTTISRQLADDVAWLARSLGARANICSGPSSYKDDDGNRVECSTAYTIWIMPEFPEMFCRLKRKAERLRPPQHLPQKTIVDISPLPTEDARCITLGSVDGLYIADDFIVTHNSDLLLGLALTRHVKTIIFRREYPQLKDIVLRSQELLGGTEARFNSQTGIWRNIPGGRLLEFGAVQYEHDKNKYKGRAHDLKAFDELTEVTLSQFEFLIAWLRTTVPDQRTRVVCTSNPPTSAVGEWVINYWGPWINSQHPHPAEPGQLRWYAMVDGKSVEREDGRPFAHKGETLVPRSRSFIPASLDDNPYLKATGYGTVLQNLPEPLRSQLLYGSFRAALNDNPWQVIPTEWIEAAQARWRANPARPVGVPMTGLGVDPARGGADDTTLCARYGTWFGEVRAVPGTRTPDGASVALLVLRAVEDGAHVAMDAGPWGASAYDALKEENIRLTGINFAEWVDDTDRSGRLKFSNMRSWLYWSLREALDPATGEALSLPPDPELLADLAAPKWLPRGGRIYIESKKELRERLGRSPGKGDAVMLAWAAGGKSFQLDFA